ncbi:PIN domain-containing protein [Candidatus Curtissbacteria bacterium]|nr:PIN domain-containing protein [Candidatus Curtissbacteria bacterium]
MIKKLLVDADAFVALNTIEDSSHSKAIELSNLVDEQAILLFTSDPAFGEAVTIISQKVGLNKAIEFAEEILASQMEIIEVDAALRRSALELFKKQTSKNSRFTDCVNMAILKGKGLDTVFSFDKQYKSNKFKRFGIDK